MSASLDKIVDVTINVSNPSLIASNFSLGLIISNDNDNFKGQYLMLDYNSYVSALAEVGFEVSSKTFLKATRYFSQNPKPAALLVAGMEDNETYPDAFTRIRNFDNDWYSFCFATDPTEAQVLSVAALVEGSSVPTQFYFRTNDMNCIKSDTQQVLSKLKDGKFTRTFGWYSDSTYDNEPVDAAVLGAVSGFNSAKNNSAYTFAYKELVGVSAEDISDAELGNLLDYNGNVYVNFGNKYKFTYPAISSGGYHVDEVYLIDAAKFFIQQYTIAGMTKLRKVPYTEDGVETIVSFIQQACMKLNQIGLIAGGIWKSEPILNLQTGDAVPDGFMIQSETVASRTESEKASRIAPPIYVALISSGAIEHVLIDVYVER